MRITRRPTRQPQSLEQRSIALATTAGGLNGVYTQPWDSQRAVREAHSREALVAAIVHAVAADVADADLFQFKATALGTGADISERTPLIYALNTASSTSMSATELRTHLSLSLDYSGEAYLVEVGETLTPILGGSVKVLQAQPGQVNADGSPALIAGFKIVDDQGRELGRYDGAGRPISGQAVGLLHRVYYPFPLNPWRADPLIERAGLPIDVVHYSRLATRSLLQNAGQPAGLVTITDPSVSQESIEAFDRRLNSRLSDVTQKGRTLVVSSDVQYTQMGDGSPPSKEPSRHCRPHSSWPAPERWSSKASWKGSAS